MMKVIDIFAGPGGLAEGFSAFKAPDGLPPFRIALSIEKDPCAHQTLTLRSFFRQFEPGDVPDDYYDYLRDSGGTAVQRRKCLFDAWPRQAARAERAAFLAELGKDDRRTIRERIWEALEGTDEFILLGGPPCQAYSVMGRSRNRGNPKYCETEDKRQTLYVEYLQVLADHHPAVFVMRSVSWPFSPTQEDQSTFEQKRGTLRTSSEAVKHAWRRPERRLCYAF